MEAHNGSTAPQSQQRLLPVIDRSISARLRQQQTTINTANDTQTAAASAHQTSVYLVTDHSNRPGRAISPCARLSVCPNNKFQIQCPLTYIFGMLVHPDPILTLSKSSSKVKVHLQMKNVLFKPWMYLTM